MYLPDYTLLQGGKYKIIRFIASGGFGCTYEAEHVLLKKRVAIKEFFVKDFCNRDETTAHVTVATQSKTGLVTKLRHKFMEEAQALNSFQHPGIVHVTDVFEENGTAYYVMDYIEGESLSEKVKRQGPLHEALALKYIRQVAKALEYVHDHHRLHLDIKPGNIMIDNHDQAILIDFGASKQYDEENGENTSTLMGKTPGYAPLEQMGNDVSHFLPATDIYSLGATLYKLLTGKTPPEANLMIIGDESLIFPTSISKSTKDTILKSMEIKQNKRIQTVMEFLNSLSAIDVREHAECSNEETILDTPQTGEQPSQTAHSSNNKTNRKYIVLWGLLFLIGLFAIVNIGNHSNEIEEQSMSTQSNKSNNDYLVKVADQNTQEKSITEDTQQESTTTYDRDQVDTPATYPNGERGLLEDISKNLIYPSAAIDNEIEGTVILKIRINSEGYINNIKILQSLSHECDQAAIDAVNKLGVFKPAQHHGTSVGQWFTLPIRFRLE